MRKIRFDFGSVVLEAELLATPAAEAIWRELPMKGTVLRWGKRFTFPLPSPLSESPMRAQS